MPPLNDSERRKLRRKAAVVHWMAQIYVLLLILITIFGVRAVGENYAKARLGSVALATLDTYNNFNEARARHLTAFLPPADSTAWRSWAMRMQEYLGQRAAVFLQNGREVTWLNRPAYLEAVIPQVERRLLPQPGDTMRGHVDSLGAMQIEMHGFEREPADSTASQLWVVGPLSDSLRWGVVLSYFDSWQAFFKDLDRAPGPSRHTETRLARHFLQADQGRFSYRTGIRAVLDGKTIFSSPGLDSHHPSFHSDLRRLQIDYYLSRADMFYGSFASYPIRWSRVLAYAVFMLIFALYYRWVRRLTAPE